MYLRRGGIYNSVEPSRCQVYSCLKRDIPLKMQPVVPIGKSFSAVFSQPLIASGSV